MVAEPIEREIAALVAESGRGKPRIALEPCPAGGNNRVYRVMLPGETLIAKWYFAHPSDPRDRLGAETSLLRYAAEAGIACVPRLVGSSREANLALYSYVEGDKPAPGEIDAAHVDAAALFFRRLNEPGARRHGNDLPVASDACFSIAAHLQLLERRIARIAAIAPRSDLDAEALRFAASIGGRWTDLRSEVIAGAKALGLPPEKELAGEARCVSPSDFGFHNAIRRASGELCFIDFEYAGWDDPAKMVCDFFCEPAVPVAESHLDRFVGAALAGGADARAAAARARLLLPVHRMKWACIMLNQFVPDGAQRRRFADPGLDEEERKRFQLDRARRSVANLLG